jgi:hypothetical protein
VVPQAVDGAVEVRGEDNRCAAPFLRMVTERTLRVRTGDGVRTPPSPTRGAAGGDVPTASGSIGA